MRISKLAIVIMVIGLAGCNNDTRHHAKVLKLKNHHIVMQDDKGKWYEYIIKNTDVDFDIPTSVKGEFALPRGGAWVGIAKPPQEEEIAAEEETTVDETEAGDPDGAGDIGGDNGGDSGGGDSGGDSGGGDGD